MEDSATPDPWPPCQGNIDSWRIVMTSFLFLTSTNPKFQ